MLSPGACSGHGFTLRATEDHRFWLGGSSQESVGTYEGENVGMSLAGLEVLV